MKRSFAVWALLLLAAGCSKDETEGGGSPSETTAFTLEMTSSNVISESWGTRSAVSEGIVSFTAGESVGIVGDNLAYAEYATAAAGTSTTLTPKGSATPAWGQTAATFNYYAVMPYSPYADGAFEVSIPAVQKVVNGVNTTPVIAFGSGSCSYDGTTAPQSIPLTIKPYSAVMELILPGTGQHVRSLDIAPVTESDLTGGFSAELTISTNGSSTTKSAGKSLHLDFSGDEGDFLALTSSQKILIPMGDFQLAAGDGLRLTFTMEDGATKNRTICAGEAFNSWTELEGVKYYQHMTLQLTSLEQMESILYETFGNEGNSSPLESTGAGSLYQLAKYYTGYQPTGVGSKSVAYWSGMRVDLRQNAFRTDDSQPDDSYMYFGNTNNNVVGGSGTITDIAGYTACADVNGRLSFYLCNVNIGKGCEKAQLSFDVKTSGHTNVVASCGEQPFYDALKNLIRVEYTLDYGKTWQDMTNLSGTSTSSEIWRYSTETIDLSGYNDEFITFRIRATMKQTLNIDNLSVETIGGTPTENTAPSVVEVYRQTPTTAYLVCRPAASTKMTAADMQSVVPYVGNANQSLNAWPDFEVRNIDETYQVFEILLRGLETYGNELHVALNWNGQTGGRKSFYESFSNEIFSVNFDRFTNGANPVKSIELGWQLSGSISTFASPNGSGSKDYDTKYSRQFDTHNPARRQEVFASYKTAPEGGIMAGGTVHRGTNNMEAWFRNTEGITTSPDVTTDGAISAGKFFKYDCEMDGWTGQLIYELEGYIQLGTGSTKGWDEAVESNRTFLCTPKIGTAAIPEGSTAAVEFSFEVAKYDSSSVNEVEVIRIEGDTKSSLGRFPNGSYGAFKKNTVMIPDATSETRLLIGAPSGTTSGGRFFVDNITLRK